MKKKILLFLCMLMTAAGTVSANVGDVIGTVYNTDIVAYINHYAIPSYAVNGTSCIVAEDLKNFGFDVIWDNDSRTLSIKRNSATAVTEMAFSKSGAASSKFADLLETDIGVWGNNIKITSYAINGYTIIPIEELTMFGTCSWVEEERALKLWVDNLHIRSEKQYVTSSSNTGFQQTVNKYYSGTSVPDYTYVTGVPLKNITHNQNRVCYEYSYTKSGEFSEMVYYIDYLENNGWSCYDKKSDSRSISYYYAKGSKLIGISYIAKYDEIWIMM